MQGGEQHTQHEYLHHKDSGIVRNIREIVFGVQDGMVSTLGAVTGVAVGTGNIPTIILAGVAIIAVESVSMAIGSYVSSDSEERLSRRFLDEEREEINACIACEAEEAKDLFIRDGWPEALAVDMAQAAEENPTLMLKEMAYRELGVSPHPEQGAPVKNGVTMFGAYIIGGLIPLSPYFFLPASAAMPVSMPITLAGLFILGVFVARYTAQHWLRAGLKLTVFGGVALLVGIVVGTTLGV